MATNFCHYRSVRPEKPRIFFLELGITTTVIQYQVVKINDLHLQNGADHIHVMVSALFECE